MNIHVFFNDGQKILFDDFFKPSIKDDWNIVVHRISNIPKDADFGTSNFKKIIYEKISVLVEDILPSESKNGFILSDIDIQFFKSCYSIINESLKKHEIVFQKEGKDTSAINTGFIAMKPTKNVIDFWTNIKESLYSKLESEDFINEQALANSLIDNPSIKLNWGIFPSEFWAFSNLEYRPKKKNIKNIYLHHANCTDPHDNKDSLTLKIEQIELVKENFKLKSNPFYRLKKSIMKKINK